MAKVSCLADLDEGSLFVFQRRSRTYDLQFGYAKPRGFIRCGISQIAGGMDVGQNPTLVRSGTAQPISIPTCQVLPRVD